MFPVDPALYAAFVTVSIGLIVTPGPSVLLIVSNSLVGGRRNGLLTVLGTSLGMAVPLALAIIGLGSVADRMAGWFNWLRWAGVAWLLFQGLREFRSPAPVALSQGNVPGNRCDPGDSPQSLPGTRPRPVWQGFTVSLLNPTTTPFFFAFLPQFMAADLPPVAQLLVLGLTFLGIAAVTDTTYALLSARAGSRLGTSTLARWRGRLSGGLMIASAVALGLARAG